MEIRSLTIGYGKHVVGSRLSACIRSSQLCCLFGPNGAGKSTLMRTLAGFIPPLAGEIVMDDGRNLAQLSARQRARTIGVVLTDRPDIRNITVRELVAMGRQPYTNFLGTLTKTDRQAVEEAISMTGIEDLASRDMHTLSDGERQKAMIAKALAQQTPVILLDEPTAFLDFQSKVDTMRLLQRLAHDMGKAILVSTHDLNIALNTADRLLSISRDSLTEISKQQLLQFINKV